MPGRPGPGGRRQVQARLRRGAGGRDPRAEPGPDRAASPTTRRAVAGAALRAPARGQAGPGRRRAAADRPARRLRARADRRPPSSSGATATSSSTRSAPTPDGRLVCGFHAPGRWDEIVEVTDCLLASEAGNAARERIVQWCRAQGLSAYDRRTGEGLLRNLVVREGRRTGQLQVAARHELRASSTARRWPPPPQPLDGLLWTRIDSVAETTQRRRDRAARRRRAPRGGDRRPAAARSRPRRSSRPTPRWPSGSTGSRSSTPSSAASSASTTCTAGSARSGC